MGLGRSRLHLSACPAVDSGPFLLLRLRGGWSEGQAAWRAVSLGERGSSWGGVNEWAAHERLLGARGSNMPTVRVGRLGGETLLRHLMGWRGFGLWSSEAPGRLLLQKQSRVPPFFHVS